MGTTTLTVDNEQLSLAVFNHRKEVEKTKDLQYPVVEHFYKAAKPAVGETLVQPHDVDDHTRATKLVTGFEKVDDFAQTFLQPGTQLPAFLAQPIYISNIDETKNAGSTRVIEIGKTRTDNVDRHLDRQLADVIFRGPGASGSYGGHAAWTDWRHMNGIDSTVGYLEAASTGTNTFLTGIVKSTYPATTHPLFHNLWGDVASAAGTNGLNLLYQITVDLELRYGTLSPGRWRWYWSRLFAKFMKQALRPLEQYVSDGNMDDGKRRVTAYAGVPVHITSTLAQDGASSAATKMSCVLLDWEALQPQLYKTWDKHQTPFKDIPGTADARMSVVKVGGNLMSRPVGSMALLTNGEVY